MTRGRAGDLLRGLAAAVALVALAFGPPVLLVRFIGWPLPHNVNLDDIAHSLRGTPISDQVLLKAIAIAGWLAWANAIACLAAEVIAWRGQRAARHMPLGGLFQPLISQLVLAAGLLVGTARSMAPAPVALPAPVYAVAVQEAPPVAAPDQPDQPAPPELPTCVVHRRDSLWVLAERHLGDGLRWREIYDLNRGLPQPAGRSLRNPNLILPGWTLRLPADAVGLPAPAAAPAAPTPVSPTPTPPTPPAAPSATQPVVPTTVPAPTTTTAAQSPPTTTVGPVTSLPSGAGPTSQPGDEADDHFPVPAALAGATLLAAALIIKIDALRRRQMRHRPPGHTIPPPTREAQRAERLLRAAAARKPASRLDLALRLLAQQLVDAPGAGDARIDSVRVAGDTVEILLSQEVDAPPGPFEITGGRAWTLPAEANEPALHDVAERQTSPAPALVTVGRLDDADVLIDLEAESLTITGDRTTATRVLWSITAELASSPWADDIQVVYVGTPPSGLAGLDRIEAASTVEDAVTAIAARTTAAKRALESSGHGNAWSARLANHGDGWPPTIVVIADDQAADPFPGATVVRVADQAAAGERELAVDETGCTLEPLGLRLALPGLPADLVEPTEQLLVTALSDDPGPEIDLRVPEPARYVTPPELIETESISAATEGRVLVRVLGPVVIEGAPHINRRRVKELIVYLALHPDGVTDEQITAALWPGDTPTRAAFNQTVTRARAALGDGPDGQPYIGYVDRGLYKPSPYLLCDAVLLERAAAIESGIDDIEVNGQPFAASDGFEWAYVEGHAYRAAALIDRVRDRTAKAEGQLA